MNTVTFASIDLQQPLPREIIGTRPPWFNRYKVHPVFSLRWILLRFISWGTVLFLLNAPSFMREGRTAADNIVLALQVAAALLLGPLLAHLVRRRRLPLTLEWPALIGAMLIAAGSLLIFSMLFEQQLLELVGAALHTSATYVPATLLGDGPLLLLLGGGLGLFGYQRERLELTSLQKTRELARLASKQRTAEMRLAVLAAQVEPHFLFNTLAGIRSAVTADPARASAMIDSLSDYLRLTIPRLRSGQISGTTLREQFEIVAGYLRLNSLRLTRLKYSLDLPPVLEAAMFPSLILISLVENAVVHGIEPKKEGGHIRLSARRSTTHLEVSVEDDGVGFGATPGGSGIGLTNIRERLAELFDAEARLVLNTNPAGGVTATVVIPLSNA